ncbi:hypothetical protein [Dictyobacter arantiisoli]|uniref:Uncharacterized protein n=1 Tax=Dictyobacter arantiisoli TaxID=2014874 RepID=A0A5A5TG18_9CHLR|nr:hypothetical protein [Dictyobacter arantiisoli]GCF10165.1 hypothetical protein KDI_37290 [Dictyobacter arantiisoli]
MNILRAAGAANTGRDAFPTGSERASAIMNDYAVTDPTVPTTPEMYPAAPEASSGTEGMINPGLPEAERTVATPHVTDELSQPAVTEVAREHEQQKFEEEEVDERSW